MCVCGGEAFLANYLLEPIKFDTRSKRKEDGKDFFFFFWRVFWFDMPTYLAWAPGLQHTRESCHSSGLHLIRRIINFALLKEKKETLTRHKCNYFVRVSNLELSILCRLPCRCCRKMLTLCAENPRVSMRFPTNGTRDSCLKRHFITLILLSASIVNDMFTLFATIVVSSSRFLFDTWYPKVIHYICRIL